MRFVAIGIAGSVLACGLAKDQVIEDQGRVCLQGVGTAQIVPASTPSPVIVTLECASACAEDVTAVCGIRQDGNDLIVESLFSYNISSDVCIEICAEIEASCELPSLAEGNYTLLHGEVQKPLVVGQMAPECF